MLQNIRIDNNSKHKPKMNSSVTVNKISMNFSLNLHLVNVEVFPKKECKNRNPYLIVYTFQVTEDTLSTKNNHQPPPFST